MSTESERLRNVAYAAKLLRLQEERARQTGPGGLMHFCRYFWKVLEPGAEFVDGWAMQAIAEHLEAVTFGELNRLLINVPPGFSKSLLSNVWWPAWEWGPMNMPHLRGLSFSYAAHLTERDNDRLRALIISKPYQEMWGDRFKLTGDAKIKIANNHMGWCLASSVGGVTTGERADRVRCLEGNTLILTDQGLIPIEEIVNKRLKVEIAGYNHETSQVEFQGIQEYEKSCRSDFVELRWSGGNLQCTSDHPIFVPGRGYVFASQVREGDQVVWSGVSFHLPELRQRDSSPAEQASEILQSSVSHRDCGEGTWQTLFDLQQNNLSNAVSLGAQQTKWASLLQSRVLREREGESLPRVWNNLPYRERSYSKAKILQSLVRHSQSKASSKQAMCCLREGDSAATVRVGSKENRKPILQSRMPRHESWWKGQEDMQLVQKRVPGSAITGTSIKQRFLLKFLRGKVSLGSGKDASLFVVAKIMRVVWENVSAKGKLAKVLLKKMCGRGSLWREFSKLCARTGPLSSRLEQDVHGKDTRKRRSSLSYLRSGKGRKTEASCPSHRLQQEESGSRKLDNVMQDLPWENSWLSDECCVAGILEKKTVIGIKRYSGERCPVYNLRVAPHHNYFANGILTHNCDDAHSVQKGESERVRSETVRWFKESMSNRLNNMEKSTIVVIMQRVNELDVAGAIIEDPEGMGYEHLCIPMRYEIEGPWSQSTKIGWRDPRKIEGELAWPERFPAHVVDSLERDLGPWAFSAQYQQSPAPRGGGIIRRNWFRLWEHPQNKFPMFENIVAAVDPAYTEKDENDPSAMAIFATFRHPETNEFGIMLVHCWRKRLQIHGDTTPRFPGESAKAYERRCGDGWGLVEWIWHCCDAYGVQQLFIEGKASGISVFQEIERRQSLRPWSCDIDTGKGGGDKVSRLTAVQPLFSQGLVWAPDRDWADMFINELSSFPKGKFDDLVDCASLALRKLREMGLIQHTDEREYEEYVEQNRPQALEPLYPV